MSESTKKRIKYNEAVLAELKARYGFGLNYIQKALRGDRVGVIPDKLIAEYKKLDNASKKAISETANQLNS